MNGKDGVDIHDDKDNGIWLGRLSMSSVMNLFSHAEYIRANENGNAKSIVVGFIYCWSSWCQRRSSEVVDRGIRPELEKLIYQIKVRQQEQQPLSSTFLAWPWNQLQMVCGHVQVDASEDSLDLFIGDNRRPLPRGSYRGRYPPEELPTLAVVIHANDQSHPMLYFLTSFQMATGKKPGGGYDSVVANDWIPAAIKELDNLPMGSILEQPELHGINVISNNDTRNDHNGDAIRIFVSGDRSSVGKSSVCLGILGNLVQFMGYAPSSLAYIKPATQCEAPQLVQAYCDQVGIECVPVGPIVYYKGFTRAFLAGETESTPELLAKASEAVDRIARGKRVILIDGVGFPAVGSICGTDNAAVACACGYRTKRDTLDNHTLSRHPPGVLLVGGSGVGAAVDAFHLNATYFEMHQVPVLGAIFNKLELDGFYSLENCRTQVTSYFLKNQHQRDLGRQPFGFVPVFAGLAGDTSSALEHVNEWIRLFGQYVNVQGIVEAAKQVKEDAGKHTTIPTSAMIQTNARPFKKIKLSLQVPLPSSNDLQPTLTRMEIEQRAIAGGAAPSA